MRPTRRHDAGPHFPKTRSARSAALSLGKLSSRWLDPKDPFRRRALAAMKKDFPGKMGEALLDALFSELTAPKLLSLLKKPRGPFRAKAGGLAVHVVPANVPNPSVTSAVLGLLAGSANAVKLSRRDSGLFPVWLDSLRKRDPALARAVAVFSSPLEARRRLKDASFAVAYGDDATVAYLRQRAPKGTPFLGYGHRASVAVFSKEALTPKLARAAARDAWMLDRRGCMSPDVFFVQEGGRLSPRAFAALLREELEKLQAGDSVSLDRALRLYAARTRELLRAAQGETLDARVPVRAFRAKSDLLRALKPYKGKLQTVALEGPASFSKSLKGSLREFGASRICRAGRMQNPPISWDHQTA